MPRITAPANVVSLVNELCVWYETHTSNNPLWYPSSTVEARMGLGRGGTPHSLVPMTSIPERLKPVEISLNQMPEDMRVAVLCRHLADFPTYHRETGNSRSTYYNQADSGYWYIAGVIDKNRI